MSEIAKLLERVKALSGPDREVDGQLALLAGWTHRKMEGDRAPYWRKPGVELGYMRSDLPAYSSSIDAALALTERVLPGWVVTDLSQNAYLAGDPWGCALAYYNGGDPSKNRAAESGYDFPKAPLAILVATLSALQDQRHEQ